jgi:hypothetical protein
MGNGAKARPRLSRCGKGYCHKRVFQIFIDAFANDYIDDAFISIASAITTYAEAHIKKTHHEKIDELKDKTKKVGGQLLSWSARVGIKD